MDGRWQPAMDWKKFQQSLLKQVPVVNSEFGNQIENFVQKAIKNFLPKSMPAGLQGFIQGSLDYELFETHRSIFVRCRLPDDASLAQVRYFATRRKLRMEIGDRIEDIPLACDINVSRTVARFADGIVEIRMPKYPDTEPFREIFVRDGGK